eukprot:GHVH01002798.1.p1 GENE.GHVH01002798.1~~GHVH01002798.1.p1  ORF type:complete len:502 (-),score=51.98 GHVH01002798.1:2004-3509(-)
MINISSDGEVECFGEGSQWRGACHSSPSKSEGRWLYEVEIPDATSAIIRVGWTLSSHSKNFDNIGSDSYSVGYGGTGKKSYNKSFVEYPSCSPVTFGAGDVISAYLDADVGSLGFMKNGKDLGEAFNSKSLKSINRFRPAVCGKSRYKVVVRVHNLKYTKPGYSQWCEETSRAKPTPVVPTNITPTRRKGPIAVVLEPTRDLARQTFECAMRYSKYFEDIPIMCSLLVGGAGSFDKGAPLEAADLLISTVPILKSHTNQNKISLQDMKFFVLDEADELMKESSQANDILKMQSLAHTHPQTLVFSATLHGLEIESMIRSLCLTPTRIDLKGKPSIPDTVHCAIMKVDPRALYPQLEALPSPSHDSIHTIQPPSNEKEKNSLRMKSLKPALTIHLADRYQMDMCMIFCRTNVDCDTMEAYMTTLGGGRALTKETGTQQPYSCVVLGGKRDERERVAAVHAFKNGRARFLICTDVAARWSWFVFCVVSIVSEASISTALHLPS